VLGEVDDAGARIRIDFATPVTGWGADLVSHDASTVIDIFDESNGLIGTTSAVATEDTFYGFHLGGGQTAARIELNFVGVTNDLFGMDDLSFVQSSAPNPTAQIAAIVESLEVLEEAGTISSGRANALTKSLDGALAKVDSQPEVAVQKLSAFVHKVMALIRSGHLSLADGQALVAAAQNAIAALLAG
jgi:hypothetical protein